MLERIFRITERGSSLRIEILGGITTFAAMAYIIVVNPAILKFAGIPAGPSTVATILASVFGCLAMGLYANRPIAVAPYMGENAFIAFGLAALGIGWQQRLGAVFLGGALFLLLTIFKARSWLANSISTSMKYSFVVGIGLFLAFIGVYETGIVTSFVAGQTVESLAQPGGLLLRAPDVPVKIGNFHDPKVLLAVLCLLLTSVLMYRKVRGAILLGMLGTLVFGAILGEAHAPSAIVALPFSGNYSLIPIAGKLDISGILTLKALPIVLTLFIMSFLDTLGTLVGVCAAGDMLDKGGNVPDLEKPMLVDAATSMFSALVGTSTSGAFIESATGIREGARTGLAPVITGLLFAGSLFFIPLIEPLQAVNFAFGPALVVVGMMMLVQVKMIDFSDISEALPCFATIAMMIFTYNIGNGLTAGLTLYPIVKVLCGKSKDVNIGSWVLAGICAVYLLFGLPH